MDDRHRSLPELSDPPHPLERLGATLLDELHALELSVRRLHQLGEQASDLITPGLIVGTRRSGDAL